MIMAIQETLFSTSIPMSITPTSPMSTTPDDSQGIDMLPESTQRSTSDSSSSSPILIASMSVLAFFIVFLILATLYAYFRNYWNTRRNESNRLATSALDGHDQGYLMVNDVYDWNEIENSRILKQALLDQLLERPKSRLKSIPSTARRMEFMKGWKGPHRDSVNSDWEMKLGRIKEDSKSLLNDHPLPPFSISPYSPSSSTDEIFDDYISKLVDESRATLSYSDFVQPQTHQSDQKPLNSAKPPSKANQVIASENHNSIQRKNEQRPYLALKRKAVPVYDEQENGRSTLLEKKSFQSSPSSQLLMRDNHQIRTIEPHVATKVTFLGRTPSFSRKTTTNKGSELVSILKLPEKKISRSQSDEKREMNGVKSITTLILENRMHQKKEGKEDEGLRFKKSEGKEEKVERKDDDLQGFKNFLGNIENEEKVTHLKRTKDLNLENDGKMDEYEDKTKTKMRERNKVSNQSNRLKELGENYRKKMSETNEVKVDVVTYTSASTPTKSTRGTVDVTPTLKSVSKIKGNFENKVLALPLPRIPPDPTTTLTGRPISTIETSKPLMIKSTDHHSSHFRRQLQKSNIATKVTTSSIDSISDINHNTPFSSLLSRPPTAHTTPSLSLSPKRYTKSQVRPTITISHSTIPSSSRNPFMESSTGEPMSLSKYQRIIDQNDYSRIGTQKTSTVLDMVKAFENKTKSTTMETPQRSPRPSIPSTSKTT